MSGEWKACETRSRLVLRPRSSNRAATSRTAVSSPEITTASGPLTAATATVSSYPASCSITSASGAWRATIAPPRGSCCMSLPRAATKVAASSRDSTPAAWAAESSPSECPARKSGRMPQDSRSRNSATSTANSAVWAYAVSSSSAASGLPSGANSTSSSGRSSCRSR